jgi:hypothetical protein
MVSNGANRPHILAAFPIKSPVVQDRRAFYVGTLLLFAILF